MGATTGVSSPGQQRAPSVARAVESLRAELDDPAMTILAIASLTLLTFTAVRITGGAPSALMELGYAPVALAAYAFGSRGGLAIGIVVGAVLGRTAVDASEIHARLADIQERERQSLLALATAAESRDTDAGEHVRRLEVTSRNLAVRAGMNERQVDQMGMAAAFHDIGKLRVPERILMKPQALDPDEWTVVRLHPVWSEQALGAGAHLALAR